MIQPDRTEDMGPFQRTAQSRAIRQGFDGYAFSKEQQPVFHVDKTGLDALIDWQASELKYAGAVIIEWRKLKPLGKKRG